MRIHVLAAIVLSTATAIACGGSQPAPTPPVSETDGGSAPSAANTSSSGADAGGGTSAASASTPETKDVTDAPTFHALPTDKKADIMMTKVVPNVGKLFKEYDGKKYAKFGCATCHGIAKTKEDPHKILPKLDFRGDGYHKLMKSKPEMVKFMTTKVVPAMADALGEKPFDMKTDKGFGCGGCHTIEKPAG